MDKIRNKHNYCFTQLIKLSSLIWAALLFSFSLHAQETRLNWSNFSSHPARTNFEKTQTLTHVDAKTIALKLMQEPFDAKRFSKDPSFGLYFKQYNQASDEFERNRLTKGIQEKFEARQRELSNFEYFTTMISGTLGQYSFQEKAFPFSASSSNNNVSIENKRNETVFPKAIYIKERHAENIVKSNPNRKVNVFLVIKPTQAATMYGSSFLDLNIVPLKANAVYSIIVIPTSGEVIAVYPSRKSLDDELLKLLSEYHKTLSDLDKAWYLGDANRESGVMERLQGFQQNLDLQKNRMRQFGWEPNKAVDSLDLAIQKMQDERHDIVKSVLTSQHYYVGKTKALLGSQQIKVQFVSFDPSTGRLVGEMEWPKLNSLHKIEGQFSVDVLGPKIVFDETKVIRRGRSKLDSGYMLRLKGRKQLFGTYKGGGFGGGIEIYVEQNTVSK